MGWEAWRGSTRVECDARLCDDDWRADALLDTPLRSDERRPPTRGERGRGASGSTLREGKSARADAARARPGSRIFAALGSKGALQVSSTQHTQRYDQTCAGRAVGGLRLLGHACRVQAAQARAPASHLRIAAAGHAQLHRHVA